MSVDVRPVDDELLAGARRAVSRWGWRDATLERIAREAGLSRVTLHRRRVSKATILRGLAAAYEADYREALERATRAAGSGGERLERALNAMCEVSERHLATIVALADEASSVFFHEAEADPVASKDFIVAPFVGILEDGAADGSLRVVDPGEWATVLTNLMHWTYQHLRQSHGWSPERARSTLIAVVADGVRA
jgi:AcrR family transcriptional regulator